MRIGVHLEALRPGKIGGLEDYVRNLLAAVSEIDSRVQWVLFGADYNQSWLQQVSNAEALCLSAEDFARLDAETLARHELDLWFCPLLVLAPMQPGLPSVVTVPDLQHEVYPQFFADEILEWRRRSYGETVEHADHLLTLSRYSKEQLVELLGAAPDHVTVTPLDADPSFAAQGMPDRAYLREIRQRYDFPQRYLYYPAAAWPHKNHRALFEALALLRDRHGVNVPLVLTGARVSDGGVDLESASRRYDLESTVRWLGYLPRQDLPGIYALSEATVIPSLFEGFGIPVVEAMRAGSPVLCSSAASLPEVGGQAALYFDPEQPAALCELLHEFLVVQRGLREDRVQAGYRQAATFSWQLTATTTLDVFRGALARTPAAARVAEPEGPLISIVTPSFNQGSFIEHTIASVMGQDYRQVEHLVIDGGSTDETVDILRRARDAEPERFDFVSEEDRGQAHAVNKGFDRARGEIIGWLNSDDIYEPGCLEAVVRFFAQHPECDVVYGRAHYVDEHHELLGLYPTRPAFDWQTLAHECFICQPTVFLRRRILERGFRLDESLQMCMDYDFWIRLGRQGKVLFLDQVLAGSRMYRDNKTLGRRSEVYREIVHTVVRHYRRLPFSWALGWAHHVWDHGDPFFNVRRLTGGTYLVALLLLVRYNWKRPQAWPGLGREIWRPLKAQMKKRWRGLQTRGSET